jgi:arabinose-5-phosphate isomerase
LSDHSRIIKIARKIIELETQSLSLLEKSIGEEFCVIVNSIFNTKGRVVICGIGKSGLIGMKIAATLNSTGTAAIFLHAAEASHGDIGVVKPEDIILAISKSGETREISDLIPFIKNNGNIIIGMTSNRSSILAKKSDFILYTPFKEEACPNKLSPTSSSITQLAIGDALAMTLMELNDFKPKDFATLHPSGSLGKKLNLKIRDLLSDNPRPQVSPKTKMKDVIVEISEKRLGATVVIERNSIVGLITDGDVRRVLSKHDNISELTAEQLMTKNPICVRDNIMAVDALYFMRNKKINHLIIMDEKNSYIGITHILDFINEGLN